MKIVVNRCYGGYGLSRVAYAWLARQVGRSCFWLGFDQGKFPFRLRPAGPADDTARGFYSALVTSDTYESEKIPDFAEDRGNPLLIQCVETLGVARASGHLAELEIVEIPAGVPWRLENHDGKERVVLGALEAAACGSGV